MFVVLVEDDPYIAQSIVAALDYLNVSVEHIDTAKAADYFIRNSAVDLCLLDLGLPDQDGLDLLNTWRKDQIHVPVLVLTARNQTQQCVDALNTGADDYLTKPFDLKELIARVHALARRNRGYSSNVLNMGEIEIHQDTQQAHYQGQLLTLSRREYSLLEVFMLYPNQVLKTEQLIDKIYGYQDSIESNALNVHIHHLRQKIHPDMIQTVRGVGYIFKVPEQSA
ncbi:MULTISPECIES: response regulator transcription factor [Acinetobacter]|uniref:Response regulator transcription factor n=1 Tax=Acinetobacter geminorum TaxID=2730922 RepID=A0ABT8ZDV7_9GAMM|nr:MULTISPECIES: response regulator transcription factor [Acinetobacter]EXB35849.1 two-component system response regulator protein [Acinetobacter baumannii 1419130]MBQ1495261.1 response regulator transcription factor [Acinetobacter sp.]MDO7362899.1 response regulator transcription factor [Acinetobacter geminorum]